MNEKNSTTLFNALTIAFLGWSITASVAALALGKLRIVLFGLIGATVYPWTMLVVAGIGICLTYKFGFKMWTFLGLGGVIIEWTWGWGKSILEPSISTFSLGGFLTPYGMFLMALAIFLPILHKKWFRTRLCLSFGTFVFPIYYAIFFIFGMPTVDAKIPGPHSGVLGPLPELGYIVAFFVFWLTTFRLELRDAPEITAQ